MDIAVSRVKQIQAGLDSQLCGPVLPSHSPSSLFDACSLFDAKQLSRAGKTIWKRTEQVHKRNPLRPQLNTSKQRSVQENWLGASRWEIIRTCTKSTNMSSRSVGYQPGFHFASPHFVTHGSPFCVCVCVFLGGGLWSSGKPQNHQARCDPSGKFRSDSDPSDLRRGPRCGWSRRL